MVILKERLWNRRYYNVGEGKYSMICDLQSEMDGHREAMASRTPRALGQCGKSRWSRRVRFIASTRASSKRSGIFFSSLQQKHLLTQ